MTTSEVSSAKKESLQASEAKGVPEGHRLAVAPAKTATRILVTESIAEDGLERLKAGGEVEVRKELTPDELRELIVDYDALVVRSETKVTREIIAAGKRLRVIGRAGVGVDNIDVEAATEHGILVLNAPTGNTIAAAEHTIALMMAMVRNIPAAERSLRSGKWERSQFVGTEVREKTLGVIGLGKIGFEVARIAGQGLLMHVIAHDPLATEERAELAGATLVPLQKLIEEADVITVHVPVTEQTRGLIGRAEIAQMKKGARLLNVARGGIIDEAALAEALNSGQLAGAAIDVFTTEPPASDDPLLTLPNIVVTPHLGASTQEAQINVAFDVADQVVEVLHGGSARYAVNSPAIDPEVMAQLAPYFELLQKMGSMAAQLATGKVKTIRLTYAGALADSETSLLTAEALKGFLAHFSEARINSINARAIAKSVGIDVDERKSTKSAEYTNYASLEVVGDQKLLLGGTQFEGHPHLMRYNDFRIDLEPRGNYLVVSHEDRPGVVASVSDALAKHDVNIAKIELGRDAPRGMAVMLMEVDEVVSPELREQIRESAGLKSLAWVVL